MKRSLLHSPSGVRGGNNPPVSQLPGNKFRSGFISWQKQLAFLFFLTAWLSFGASSALFAQSTTITTNFTNNNGSGTTTFNLQNTNPYAIIITDVAGVTGASGSQTAELYYKTTPVNGAPGAISTANGWNLAATGTFVGVANSTTSTTQPLITGMSFTIPAGATYGIAVSSGSLRYSTLPAGVQTLSGGGVNLTFGDNISYGGGSAPTAPTFTPRGFIGSLTFMPATPCVAPPTGGQAVSSVPTVCPNTNFQLSLTGASGGQGMTYQWQSSANGTTGWTAVTGLTNANVTTTQTATTWYRAVLTCSGQTANSLPVQVTTNSTPVSGIFTIDQNGTPSATTFTSISAAIASIQCGGANGPIVFNVASGSGPYEEQVVVPVIPGTSATNTVTFNGNGNTISANPSGNLGVITLDGADYVKFDNFTLTLDSAATAGWGVQFLNGADNNTISNNTINMPINSTSTNFIGIGTGVTYSTYGNHTNNSKIQNNIINGGYYGIRMNGSSSSVTSAGNEITGNQVKDPYYYGIYLYYSGTMLIEGNNISRMNRTDGTTFYSLYNGYSKSNIISKNRIHGIGGSSVYGIYNYYSDSPTGAEATIKNNLIYDLNNTGTTYAMYTVSSDGSYFFHNTVDLRNTNNTGTVYGFYQSTTATNLKFQNNIISINGGVSGNKYAVYYGVTTSTITSNNNDLYATNGANVGYYSGAKATLADWQTASSQDANSVSADPMFVNLATGILRPTNSTVNNIGAPVTPPVTDDITGATRNTTTPDPGAYEFTPANYDAGVISLITPTSPVQPNANQSFQVTIKNYGISTLTSATITATITGTASQTITYNWTGSLAPGATSATISIGNFSFPAGSYTVNVCTSLPNGVADPNPGNDCFTTPIVSCTALAGNYTINQNLPGSAINFTSLADAAQRLSSCGISGPVTFSVVAGTGPYNEQLVLNAISGVSATNTVTFNGNGNTISATPGGGAMGAVTFDGATFVKVNNFVITLDAAATAGWGVQFLNGADNNTISNNTINMPINSTSTNFIGIGTGVTYSTYGNHTNNSKIQNNIINGGYYGIRMNGSSSSVTSAGNEITGNQVKDPYYYGIYLYYSGTMLIEGNNISRMNRTDGTTFYSLYNGYSKSNIISKNRIHGIGGSSVYGIYNYYSDSPTGAEATIKNNLIYDLNNTGTTYAMYTVSSDGSYFFHNTVDLRNTNNTGTVYGFYQSTTATNLKFQNNIISIDGGVSGNKYAVYYGVTTSTITSNNNDLYAANGANVGYYSGAKTTLTDWQTASSQDANSVSVDPVFLDHANGDFHPTVVAVNNLGLPLPAVTDDITGAPRSTTTPDMGAFEFTVNPNDVGIIAISGPSTSGCGLSATERITVTIKNFGSTTQTNIPLSYKLNLNSPVNQTYIGSIAANATDTLTFSTRANMSTSGPYTIVATTSLTGDANTSNDSDTLRITNSLIPGLPMTFDFETATTGIARFRTVINSKSNIYEDTAASFGPGSTKGMIMDGVDNTGWVPPVGVTDPWVNNMNNFSAAYICISPAGGAATDSLWLTFDLKQLFKTANANTNFRVTVDGTQVGPTYRPPFTGSPIVWNSYKVDLTAFKNQPTVQIGLESSVKEAFANGTGTANLLDNVQIKRRIVAISGTKNDVLAAKLSVYPNPSNGNFNVSLQTGKAYSLEVTDLAGKTVLKQTAKGDAQLKLENAAKGVYLLKVQSEGNATVRKLIVE